jgi:hypothetical protein
MASGQGRMASGMGALKGMGRNIQSGVSEGFRKMTPMQLETMKDMGRLGGGAVLGTGAIYGINKMRQAGSPPTKERSVLGPLGRMSGSPPTKERSVLGPLGRMLGSPPTKERSVLGPLGRMF